MTLFEQRIAEVQSYFDNKDTVLGYRKLMDCAMDTQDMSIYKKTIELTAWKEEHPDQQEQLIEKSLYLLKEVSAHKVTAYKTDTVVLSATGIEKRYGGSGFKLGPVEVQIRKGNVYGLVGENGNGKTTLLRILARELSYDKGDLDYSFDTPANNEFDLRTKLVYIPQRTAQWYGSLKDNLKYVLTNYGIPPAENETRVLMMIARLGLWNYRHLKWSELSSGYKMRFELARTLLRQPELLLLDEPLANLDVLAQQVILEDLKSICNSVNNPIALILSSQQLYEVEKISDKVIFLKNGQYRDSNNDAATLEHLIVEIESKENREVLQEAFAGLNLDKLVYNGGVYLAYFPTVITFDQVLLALGTYKVSCTYTRNISSSTRRFFVS